MKPAISSRTKIAATVLLVSFFVACGEPDDNGEQDPIEEPETTGIAGAWITGDYLVGFEESPGEEEDSYFIPVEDELQLPGLHDPTDCTPPEKMEFFPDRNIGPEHGSVDWISRYEADDSSFALSFQGEASATQNPNDVAWERNGTGDNAYVLEIHNVEDEPLRFDASWTVEATRQVEADSDSAAATLDVAHRLFVGLPGDCQEVTDDYELFDPQLEDDAEFSDEADPDPFDIDAERVLLVVYASAGVEAETRENGEDRTQPAAASLYAELLLEVNP